MSQMLKSSGAMGVATLLSRVLGMVREMVFANFMGDGAVASAFNFAFMIPNLFRRLLGEGALTAAFIPIFKDKEKNAGEVEMWRAANAVISGLVVAVAVLTGLVMLGITVALSAMSLEDNTRLMLELLRLMFPYLWVICLTAIFMGMLNARGSFFIPAMGSAVMNIVLISSVYLSASKWLAPILGQRLETQIFGLAIGALLAGLAQALFQLPNLHSNGFRWQWVSPWRDETVREVVRKMIPGMLGVAAFQLNIVVTNAVAFSEDDTIVASFSYAVRLMELPQGVFGISLATFLLPALSGLAAEKNFGEFRSTLGHGMRHLLFLNLLASILLIILAEPIIRLLFQHGQFDDGSTHRASRALMFLAPGLIAFSMVNILARAFYALGDTTTPMKISIFCLAINLIFALYFIGQYKQAGLGLANTLSAIFNVSLLAFALRKKLRRLDLMELRKIIAPLLGAGVAAGLVAFGALQWSRQTLGTTGLWPRLVSVFGPMTLATVVYLALTSWLRVGVAVEFLNFLLARARRKKN